MSGPADRDGPGRGPRGAGARVRVRVTGISRHGDGVAPSHGGELHIPGVFPDDVVDARVEYVSTQRPRAHGRCLQVVTPSPARRAPPCRHHGACSGCALMPLTESAQRAAKLALLRERYGLPVDRLVVAPDAPPWRYRTSSRRLVFGRRGALVLGSAGRTGHALADMDGCLVDHPDLVAAARELVEVGSELGVEPYDELTETGELRQAWFRTDGRGRVLLALVTSEPSSATIRALAGRLRAPAGIAWGVHALAGPGPREGLPLRPIRGPQSVALTIAGVPLEVGHDDYVPPHPEALSAAVLDLVAMPAGGRLRGRLALELYPGLGVTSHHLRTRFAAVEAVDPSPGAARRLGLAPQLVEAALAARARARAPLPDLVIANPARGGLGPTVCAQLSALAAPRLHLLSGSIGPLSDDLRALTGPAGAYTLLAARAYDSLPQTAHVDVVCWLVRRRTRGSDS